MGQMHLREQTGRQAGGQGRGQAGRPSGQAAHMQALLDAAGAVVVVEEDVRQLADDGLAAWGGMRPRDGSGGAGGEAVGGMRVVTVLGDSPRQSRMVRGRRTTLLAPAHRVGGAHNAGGASKHHSVLSAGAGRHKQRQQKQPAIQQEQPASRTHPRRTHPRRTHQCAGPPARRPNERQLTCTAGPASGRCRPAGPAAPGCPGGPWLWPVGAEDVGGVGG